MARKRRLRVEVLFALVGVIRELVLLGQGLLLRGHTAGDERGVRGGAVGGQRERLRDAHHELVGDVAETLDFALELGELALEGLVLLLSVEDVRAG